jgi:hypothetical protein
MLIVVSVLTSCARAPASGSTTELSWLKALIAEIEGQPPTNPPASIWRYTYRGAPVYFRPAQCCDVFSDLLDERGTLICHPSGGLSGAGDGKCPDFLTTRLSEMLIWQDKRVAKAGTPVTTPPF